MLPTGPLKVMDLWGRSASIVFCTLLTKLNLKIRNPLIRKLLSAVVSGGDQLKKVYFIVCTDPRLSLMTFNKFLGSPKFRGLKHSQMTYWQNVLEYVLYSFPPNS